MIYRCHLEEKWNRLIGSMRPDSVPQSAHQMVKAAFFMGAKAAVDTLRGDMSIEDRMARVKSLVEETNRAYQRMANREPL